MAIVKVSILAIIFCVSGLLPNVQSQAPADPKFLPIDQLKDPWYLGGIVAPLINEKFFNLTCAEITRPMKELSNGSLALSVNKRIFIGNVTTDRIESGMIFYPESEPYIPSQSVTPYFLSSSITSGDIWILNYFIEGTNYFYYRIPGVQDSKTPLEKIATEQSLKYLHFNTTNCDNNRVRYFD